MILSKPRIFIGSSIAGLTLANTIQENLQYDATAVVWNQSVFELSGNTLENLVNALDNFDFAIFVCHPDDIIILNGEKKEAVRDNVIFELGLFIGRIGRDRVYFLIPSGSHDLHLPTDLAGITAGTYDSTTEPEFLPSALGPFCNKVRRQLNKYGSRTKDSQESVDALPSNTNESIIGIDTGTDKDEFNNTEIFIAPTVFFANRMTDAFPGVRGIREFHNPKEAIYRLTLLLHKPLSFDKAIRHGTDPEPIWWRRGSSGSAINHFSQLSDDKCLMNCYELRIRRIAAFHSDSYYQSFVYVEVNPDSQTGLYNFTNEDISNMTAGPFSHAREEYGLFEGIAITREEYDDGAAEIEGKIVDTHGAKLRYRYLSAYNFLIASKYSPINNPEYDDIIQKYLDDVLKDDKKLESMTEYIAGMRKNRYDN